MEKILIAGLSKTGTTALLYQVAAAIEGQKRVLFEPDAFVPVAGDEQRNVVCKILIGRHVNAQSFRAFSKKVTLVRDPRDRLVSIALYRQFHSSYATDDLVVARIRALLEQKEKDPASVPLLSLIEAMGRANGIAQPLAEFRGRIAASHRAFCEYEAQMPDAFVFRYEDFVAKRLEHLEGYLGIALAKDAVIPARHGRVARTKGAGGWAHWFTPIDVESFRALLEPFIERYGYDATWELAPAPEIRPEHCSLYFLRLISERRARLRSARCRQLPESKVSRA